MKLDLHHYIELLALVISINTFWGQKKWGVLHWFQPFLIFILLIELSGKFVASVLKQPNAWIYNFSIPIEYCFYSFIFFHSVNSKRIKNIILVSISAYVLFVVVTLLISKKLTNFNTGFLLFGSGMMVFFGCLFFWDLFNNPGEVRLVSYPQFWVFSGLLLFNLGEFSYNLFADILFNQIDKEAIFFRQINNYLNFVLYLCISIGLLCRRLFPEKLA